MRTAYDPMAADQIHHFHYSNERKTLSYCLLDGGWQGRQGSNPSVKEKKRSRVSAKQLVLFRELKRSLGKLSLRE
jgi:hypothetical protein